MRSAFLRHADQFRAASRRAPPSGGAFRRCPLGQAVKPGLSMRLWRRRDRRSATICRRPAYAPGSRRKRSLAQYDLVGPNRVEHLRAMIQGLARRTRSKLPTRRAVEGNSWLSRAKRLPLGRARLAAVDFRTLAPQPLRLRPSGREQQELAWLSWVEALRPNQSALVGSSSTSRRPMSTAVCGVIERANGSRRVQKRIHDKRHVGDHRLLAKLRIGSLLRKIRRQQV